MEKMENEKIQDARAAILGILGEMQVMGANTSEQEEIMSIISRLEKRELSPEKAEEEALAIKNSKQDYH